MTRSPRRRPIRRVAVIAKVGPPEGVRLAEELGRWLEARGVEVRFDRETLEAMGRSDGTPRAALPRGTDLAVVAGGDGTLLSVARAAAPAGVPILGVNFGGLGFLAEVQPEEVFPVLEKVLAGRFTIDERHALRVRFRSEEKPPEEYVLLNDAVINKGALARMISIEVRVDGEPVATFTADGLIVSTPTGSTAYNLSAGGPIIDPRLGGFVIAPICPHTLSYRPLVVPSDVTIEATLLSDGGTVFLTLDGQVGLPMKRGDGVIVDDYPRRVGLVRVSDKGFFDVLRRKLHWGDR